MEILIQPAHDLIDCVGRRFEHGGADVADGARNAAPLPEAMFLGQYETTFAVLVRNSWLAEQSMENGRIVANVSLRMRIFDRVGTLKGGIHSRDGTVDVAKKPKGPREHRQTGCSGVLADGSSSYSFSFIARSKFLHSSFGHFSAFDDSPHQQADQPHPPHRVEHGRPITARFGKTEQSHACLPPLRQLPAQAKRHH